MTLWKRERNIYIETHICICIYVCIYHSYILGKCTYKCISPYIHMCLYITYTHVSPKVVQAQTLINWISKVTLLENLAEGKPAWVRASSKGWRILKKKKIWTKPSPVLLEFCPHIAIHSHKLSRSHFFLLVGGGWWVVDSQAPIAASRPSLHTDMIHPDSLLKLTFQSQIIYEDIKIIM